MPFSSCDFSNRGSYYFILIVINVIKTTRLKKRTLCEYS